MQISDLTGTLQAKALNFNSNGDNAVISAVAGQAIYVYAIDIYGATATVITIKDDASGNALFGPTSVITSLKQDMFPNCQPRYKSAVGGAFNINLGAGNAFGGAVWYVQR